MLIELYCGSDDTGQRHHTRWSIREVSTHRECAGILVAQKEALREGVVESKSEAPS